MQQPAAAISTTDLGGQPGSTQVDPVGPAVADDEQGVVPVVAECGQHEVAELHGRFTVSVRFAFFGVLLAIMTLVAAAAGFYYGAGDHRDNAGR